MTWDISRICKPPAPGTHADRAERPKSTHVVESSISVNAMSVYLVTPDRVNWSVDNCDESPPDVTVTIAAQGPSLLAGTVAFR